jgi:Aspartyl protease
MKWKIPLIGRSVGGVACNRPLVTLLVATPYGLTTVQFWFDTGADVTTIPVPLARDRGIQFPVSEAARGTATGLVGRTTRYRGSVRVLIAGEAFEWPCDFLVPPPSAPQGVAANQFGILGRATFLTAFAACVDDKHFYLRRRFLDRPRWYRLFRRLWPLFPKPHDAQNPL